MDSRNNVVPESLANFVKVELEEPFVNSTSNSPPLQNMDSACIICLNNNLSTFKYDDTDEHYLHHHFSNFCTQYLNVDTTFAQFLQDKHVQEEELFCSSCEKFVGDILKTFEKWNEIKIKLLGSVNKLGLIISQSSSRVDVTINDRVRDFRRQLENNCFTKAQIIQPTISLASITRKSQPDQTFLDPAITQQDEDESLIQDYTSYIKVTKCTGDEPFQITPDDDDDGHFSDGPQEDDDWLPPERKRTRFAKRRPTTALNNKRRNVKRKSFPLQSLSKSKEAKSCGASTDKSASGSGNISGKLKPRTNYLYNCSECKMRFRKKAPFIQHNLTVHEGINLEKFLECSVCQEIQADIIELQNHLKSKHDCPPEMRSNFCVHCCTTEPFATAQLRDLHMVLDHSKSPHILCEVKDCSEKFLSVSDYCNHLRAHTSSISTDTSIHCCEYCGRGFLGFQHCELHKFYHTNTKNEQGFHVCPVQQCVKENKHRSVSKLINHYNKKHLVEEEKIQLYHCDLCRRSSYYMFRKELLLHQRINHGREVQCQLCGNIFMGHNALRVHHFNKHPDKFKGNLILSQRQSDLFEESPIADFKMEHVADTSITAEDDQLELALYRTCPYCSKKFPTFKDMEKHKTREHNIRINNQQVQCEVCGATVSKAQLSRHVLIHKEPEISCPYPPCPRKFRREENMIMHVKKIHDRKESDREFVCDTCGKRYLSSGILNRHVKEQHMKLYPCHLCPKMFNSTSKANEHLWAFHTDEKFQCKWCPSEYSFLSKLKAHTKKKHPEEAHLLPTFYSYSSKPKTYKNIMQGEKFETSQSAD